MNINKSKWNIWLKLILIIILIIFIILGDLYFEYFILHKK